ncbi:MAG: hypothetical protein ACO35C_03960 [Pontimonas sp.]
MTQPQDEIAIDIPLNEAADTPTASDSGDDTPSRRTRSVLDDEFKQTCIDIITPSLETDVRDMVRGRIAWRRTSTVFEVLGRISGATGTIIAFAGSSELTQGTVSGALAFSAGCLGTISIVSTLFASFARQQALERSAAVNSILETVHLKSIPDIAKALDVQGESSN